MKILKTIFKYQAISFLNSAIKSQNVSSFGAIFLLIFSIFGITIFVINEFRNQINSIVFHNLNFQFFFSFCIAILLNYFIFSKKSLTNLPYSSAKLRYLNKTSSSLLICTVASLLLFPICSFQIITGIIFGLSFAQLLENRQFIGLIIFCTILFFLKNFVFLHFLTIPTLALFIFSKTADPNINTFSFLPNRFIFWQQLFRDLEFLLNLFFSFLCLICSFFVESKYLLLTQITCIVFLCLLFGNIITCLQKLSNYKNQMTLNKKIEYISTVYSIKLLICIAICSFFPNTDFFYVLSFSTLIALPSYFIYNPKNDSALSLGKYVTIISFCTIFSFLLSQYLSYQILFFVLVLSLNYFIVSNFIKNKFI